MIYTSGDLVHDLADNAFQNFVGIMVS